MKSKRFWLNIVYLFIFFILVFSLQEMAQAGALTMPKDQICRPLRLECFPLPGSPSREKLIRKKILGNELEVLSNKVHKLPNSKKSFSTRKQNCAGLDCLPSNAEELAQKSGETLDEN